MVTMLNVDKLANEIRRVDGSHTLGAGALAEALMPWLESQAVYRGSGERITRKDLNTAHRIGQENGRLFEQMFGERHGDRSP